MFIKMKFTENIHKAIIFSERYHRPQKRKGSETPYIVHPLSVALILARSGADEEVIISAILHDIVEDCGVSVSEIKEMFGEKVCSVVSEVGARDSNQS